MGRVKKKPVKTNEKEIAITLLLVEVEDIVDQLEEMQKSLSWVRAVARNILQK